jgi:hypothetical protein
MKWEICHSREAVTVLTQSDGNQDEELYVCRECEKAEKARRKKKSFRISGDENLSGIAGMSISLQGFSGKDEAPPPIIEAIMNAVTNVIAGENASPSLNEDGDKGKNKKKSETSPVEVNAELNELPLNDVDGKFVMLGALHLEALHLVGELESLFNLMQKFGVHLEELETEGMHHIGHIYKLKYTCSEHNARLALRSITVHEQNARNDLLKDLPIVLADAVCRPLALLKNCRLLTPAEFLDLLSPMRLAAIEGLLDGITLDEIDQLISEIELRDDKEDEMKNFDVDYDMVDSERANFANARFENVILSDKAEELFR